MEREERYNFITIGERIQNISNIKTEIFLSEDNEYIFFEKIGREYFDLCKKRYLDIELQFIIKELLANRGFSNIFIIDFIITNNLFKDKQIITNNIMICSTSRDKNAQCTLKLFHNIDSNYLRSLKDHYGFYVEDMIEECNTFVVLDNLISFDKGAGYCLVSNIQKTLNCPIVLQAGFLEYGEYVEYQKTGNFSVIDNLVKYYEKLGFKNVNNSIGCYDDSIIMTYGF